MHALLRTATLGAALFGLAVHAGAATVANTTLKLLPAQSAALSQQITLRYDEVNDSRCPKDKQCVLAGKIVYHFTLTSRAATETFDLTEDKPEFSPVMLKGMRIVLANPTVPPVPGTLAQPSPYPVNLNVFQD